MKLGALDESEGEVVHNNEGDDCLGDDLFVETLLEDLSV
jgi:hypothetical protein